jgi:hypothetical protein
MHRYIIKTASAKMPNSCWGTYRRVAVLEVDGGVREPRIIREGKGVRIIRTWEKLSVGKTERCAYQRALAEAAETKQLLEQRVEEWVVEGKNCVGAAEEWAQEVCGDASSYRTEAEALEAAEHLRQEWPDGEFRVRREVP